MSDMSSVRVGLVALAMTTACAADDGRRPSGSGIGGGGIGGDDWGTAGEAAESGSDGEGDELGSTGGSPSPTTGVDPADDESSGGPPPVEPPPPGLQLCEVDGRLVFEAEDFTSQDGFTELARPDASGGAVMQVGDDGALDFDMWFASSGRAHVWVRTYVPDGDSENNGLFIDVDGEPIEAPADHPQSGTPDIYLKKIGWSWSPEWQADSGHAGPVTFEVEAGVHTLTIHKRKIERPELDKVVLEFANAEPDGLGPDVTSCDDV